MADGREMADWHGIVHEFFPLNQAQNQFESNADLEGH
jgi:hypothetical protein